LATAQTLPSDYTVTLHCDRSIALNPAAIPTIHSWALRLVSSSQENSDEPRWAFPIWELEQEYLDALSGDYLRVDFAALTTISTVGGVVHARAIVMRIDPLGPDWRSKYPDHFDDALFTIDENGAAVGYALYSGLDVTALDRAIKKAFADPDACKLAKGLFVKDSQLPPFLEEFLRQNGLED
jgi:hypothetical protein